MSDDPKGRSEHEVIAMPHRADPAQADATPPPAARPMLSEGQWTALHNLALKQTGGDVPWINIADARALTDAGFAERSREGWSITAEGAAELKAEKARSALED